MNTPTDAAPVRFCTKCRTAKPFDQFARHKKLGHQSWCRRCMTQARRDWRERIKHQNDGRKYELVKLADMLRKRRAANERRLARLKAAALPT